MTSAMMNWFSPSTIHALGWALVHFLWQGTAVAALAAVAMALCGRTSARYIVAVSALTLMFLSPLATFAYYAQQNSGPRANWPAVSFRRGRMAHRDGPYCGRQLRIANTPRTVARRDCMARASVARRSGLVQSSIGRRFPASGTQASPAVLHCQ